MPCYADLYDFFADMTVFCTKHLGTQLTDFDEPDDVAEEIREAIERIAPGGLFMEKYGDLIRDALSKE
jgi:hypothetical protein